MSGLNLSKDTSAKPESILPEEGLFSRGYGGDRFEYHGQMNDDILDNLLMWAADNKASDVTIETDKPIVGEIGGRQIRLTEKILTNTEVATITNYLYSSDSASLELKSGKDLDFAHQVRMGDRMLRYRVNCTAVRSRMQDGIQITVRTLPSTGPHIRKLGIEKEIISNWRPQNGIVWVTGPTGSGKSTLLAGGTRMIIEDPESEEKILEYSSPIEYVYDDCDVPKGFLPIAQTEIPRHLPTFAAGARNALRRKPTIIIVGESRDPETIRASIELCLTGHLVYTTLHTIGVAQTIRRAIVVFPAEERQSMAVDILDSTRMVISQLLLDRVGGGKVACREFMVFDQDTRIKLQREHTDNWANMIRDFMDSGQVTGRRMAVSAKDLFDLGQISKETYIHVLAKVKGIDDEIEASPGIMEAQPLEI